MEENELKLGLARAGDLPRLLSALPRPSAVISQSNHYFVDPEGRTARSGVMVRVREERDGDGTRRAVRLTLKRRTSIVEGVFSSQELEAPVDLAVWQGIVAGDQDLAAAPLDLVRSLCAELGIGSLVRQGTMANVRHVIAHRGFVLEVDRTTFPDGSVDVEVEVETDDPDGARALVQEVAAKAGIELFVQTKGKYARFCERR